MDGRCRARHCDFVRIQGSLDASTKFSRHIVGMAWANLLN
jgi:hypothetical protein